MTDPIDRPPSSAGAIPEPHPRRPNDPENIVGRAIAGRYLVRRCISQGGMGVIYLARQEALDREVILKVVRSDRADDEAEARFRREARSLSLLSHTNVVQIFDHGFDEDTGLWFIVMEYVRGITLSRYRKRRGGVLSLEEFLPIARQILEGVGEAHRSGLIHRDLKPSNVMLTSPDGIRLGVKILDFGLSKLARGDEEQVTRANYFAGSVMYLAPELIKNKGVDSRADVYSIGVIFYQLLSGQNPLQGDDPYELLLQQVTGGMKPLALALPPGHDLPPSLITLVDECVSLSASDRPADGRAVLERLSASLGNVVSNTTEAARAAATAQDVYASDATPAGVWSSKTNTASRARIATPQHHRPRVGLWVALFASAMVLMMMFATLGVLIALLVNNIVRQGGLPEVAIVAPASAPSSDSVASEVLRQRALMAIRDGEYERAVALTSEALAVAPQKGDLEDLLAIVTDLRDRQASREQTRREVPDEPEEPAEIVAPPEPSARSPRPRPSPRPRSADVAPPVGIAVITSTPSGVPFEIVGVARGETPFRALDVPVGLHEVLFYVDGRVVQTSRMTVAKDDIELLDVALALSAPPTFAVEVAAEPAVAVSGPSTVYVYVPSSNKPRVIQDALHAQLPGMTITAFGSYRDLKDAIDAAPPHALIAPRNVLDALGLPTLLQGRDASGSATERYLLVGTRSMTPAELGDAVIGTVDVAGRESSSEFVAKVLQTAKAPQVKRVSEETDLLPLLQVGAADAILLPESAARTLMSSTQMDLTEMAVADGAGLPAISVLDDQRRSQVEAAVRGFGSEVNAKVGVASWSR